MPQKSSLQSNPYAEFQQPLTEDPYAAFKEPVQQTQAAPAYIPPEPPREAAPNLGELVRDLASPSRVIGRLLTGQRGPAPTVMSEGAANVLRGIPQAITAIPGALSLAAQASPFGAAYGYLSGDPGMQMRAQQELLQGAAAPIIPIAKTMAGNPPLPESPEWTQAQQASGAMLGSTQLPNVVGPLSEAYQRMFPGKAAIQAKLNQVATAANPTQWDPLLKAEVDAGVARAQQLAARGAPEPPRPLAKYIERQQPTGFGPFKIAPAPMTYEEGADFYSAARRLSDPAMKEIAKTPMQAQLIEFASNVKNAQRDAAVRSGVGDLYDEANNEYRQAKNREQAAAILQKWTVRAAVAKLGFSAARHLMESGFFDRISRGF